jgi:predicted extracellular nuclease
MFLSRRRIILIGAITAVAITIILLPLILTITLPNLNNLTIDMSKVETISDTNNTQGSQLNVVFVVYNPTKQTLTTSRIEYELFADGKSLGSDTLSFEDIPLNGRPQFYSNSSTTLQSTFKITSNSIAQLFNKIVENHESIKQIKWRVTGVATIESGFSSSSKEFSNEI